MRGTQQQFEDALERAKEMASSRAELIRRNGLITNNTPVQSWWRNTKNPDGAACLIIGPPQEGWIGPYSPEQLYFAAVHSLGVPPGYTATWSNENGQEAVLEVLDKVAAGDFTMPEGAL